MVPVTFLYDWEFPSDKDRQTVMYEFAANGAKHLVLTDTLIKMIEREPKLYRELPKEVEKANLDFVDAHAPFMDDCDINCPDPAVRPFMLAHLKLVLRIVADFGVRTCTVHIGNLYYRGYTMEQHREATCRSLDEVLPLAEQLGLTICLENLQRIGSHVDDLLGYFDKYPSKNLGACFDSGHANIMEKGRFLPKCSGTASFDELGVPVQWEKNVLDRLLPHVVNCHLHDNDASADQHMLPGKGNVDWKTLVPKLLSAPRLACVQSEVIPLRVQQPIRPLCDKFRELFGEL